MNHDASLLHSLAHLARRLFPKSSYRRDVAQTSVTNIALLASGTLSGVVLARLLGPHGRGELAAIQSFPALFAGLTTVGLFEAVIYHARGDAARASRYATSAAFLATLLAVPLTLAGAALAPRILPHYSEQVVRATQVYVAILFPHVLLGAVAYRLRAANEVSPWNRLRLVPSLMWLLLVALAWGLRYARAHVLALAYLAALVSFACGALVYYRSRLDLRWRPETRDWPALLRYALPLTFASAPEQMEQRLDQLLIAILLTPTDLGYYSVGVSWSALLRLPAAAVSATAFPRSAALATMAQQRAFFRRAARLLVGLTLAAGTMLALMAPAAIPVAFGADFAGAVGVAMLLLVSQSLRNFALLAEVVVKTAGRPSAVLYSRWAAFVVLIALAPLLIQRSGVHGVACATIASSGAGLLVSARYAHRAFRAGQDRRGPS